MGLNDPDILAISAGGEVFGERKLYYSPEAPEKAGREWIDLGY
ncbi:hypothetical protein [Anabaena sp. PCC 7108]|nr:hypothetical protein [Anabaena sp. PCC 7108]